MADFWKIQSILAEIPSAIFQVISNEFAASKWQIDTLLRLLKEGSSILRLLAHCSSSLLKQPTTVVELCAADVKQHLIPSNQRSSLDKP